MKHIVPLVSYYKIPVLLPQHNQTFFTLTFRSRSETFIRRSLFSSSGSCHDRDVTWQEIGHSSVCTVAALVSVLGSSSLFPNMCCFFNPSSTFVRFPYVRPICCHVTFLSWQEPEEELNKLLLMNVSGSDRNVNLVKTVWLGWSNLRRHLRGYLGYPMILKKPLDSLPTNTIEELKSCSCPFTN